jgi:hypothetical protein
MTTIPQLSPGCFGSAVAFKKDDTVCRGCKFAQLCEPAHLNAQKALRDRYGIKTTQEVLTDRAKARAEEKALREASRDAAALVLPKKTQELIDRLDRGSYDVKGKLSRGENPFGASMRFMQMAAHILLRMPGDITRATIASAYVRKFEWQQGTADAHARMAIQALEHVGAIINNDGIVSVRRN